MKKKSFFMLTLILFVSCFILTSCSLDTPDIDEYLCVVGMPICRDAFRDIKGSEILWDNNSITGNMDILSSTNKYDLSSWNKYYYIKFMWENHKGIIQANKEKANLSIDSSSVQDFNKDIVSSNYLSLDVSSTFAPATEFEKNAHCFDVTYEKPGVAKIIASYFYTEYYDIFISSYYYKQTGYHSYVYKNGKLQEMEHVGNTCEIVKS